MKTRILTTVTFSTLLFAVPVYAHPGHGEAHVSDTAAHYLFEPMHFIPLAIALSLLLIVFQLRKRTDVISRLFSSEK